MEENKAPEVPNTPQQNLQQAPQQQQPPQVAPGVPKPKKQETYSYKGWLISDSIVKRSWAIMGHYMLATLMLYGVFIAIGLVFAIILGIGAAIAAIFAG